MSLCRETFQLRRRINKHILCHGRNLSLAFVVVSGMVYKNTDLVSRQSFQQARNNTSTITLAHSKESNPEKKEDEKKMFRQIHYQV